MTDTIDAIVIGAGVIGLAVARALAVAGHETLVLEQAAGIGTGISSRNSEVIHAGIYYPEGSQKARLCPAGKALLYAYCNSRGIPHRQCGKLIVATDLGQIAVLEELEKKGARNGVTDLRMMSAAEVKRLEPDIQCQAALYSPSSGIIDAHSYMRGLQGDIENHSGAVVLHTPVNAVRCNADGFTVHTGGPDATVIRTRVLINCAGLDACAMAARIEGMPKDLIPAPFFAKGSYFSIARKIPFRHLIYPVPEPGGLGVHLTLDIGGGARFGPDVEWVDAPGYAVDLQRAEKFYDAVRRYWPDLRSGELQPGFAGVRPKLAGPGGRDTDFIISGPEQHGVAGLVHLFGIESPGLTSSLAIADEVGGMLAAQ